MSLEQTRAAAQELLNSTSGDLEGADAERFNKLAEHAEQLRERAQQRTTAARDLVQRLASGELRREGEQHGITPRAETPDRDDDADRLAHLVDAVRAGQPHRTFIRTASPISTTVAGAATGVAASMPGLPPYLHRQVGIPFSPASGATVVGPHFAALVAQSPTTQLSAKPEFTSPTLSSATMAAYAVTKRVSDQVVRFGVGAQVVIDRLRAEVIYSVNAAVATALETAGGGAISYAGSPSQSADLGIATVWANTGQRPSAILVNEVDYPELADKAGVGPGDGIAAPVLQFNGVPLIVNSALTAGVATVVAGSGFSAHGTDTIVATLPILSTNELEMLVEQYFCLLQHDSGAVACVDIDPS